MSSLFFCLRTNKRNLGVWMIVLLKDRASCFAENTQKVTSMCHNVAIEWNVMNFITFHQNYYVLPCVLEGFPILCWIIQSLILSANQLCHL